MTDKVEMNVNLDLEELHLVPVYKVAPGLLATACGDMFILSVQDLELLNKLRQTLEEGDRASDVDIELEWPFCLTKNSDRWVAVHVLEELLDFDLEEELSKSEEDLTAPEETTISREINLRKIEKERCKLPQIPCCDLKILKPGQIDQQFIKDQRIEFVDATDFGLKFSFGLLEGSYFAVFLPTNEKGEHLLNDWAGRSETRYNNKSSTKISLPIAQEGEFWAMPLAESSAEVVPFWDAFEGVFGFDRESFFRHHAHSKVKGIVH